MCLLVAGVVRATLPAPEFMLRWEHSVEKTRWEEVYIVERDELILAQARVAGSGAGMEPPPGATLRGGAWSWQPATRLHEIRLAHSAYGGDYVICTRGACRELSALVGPPDGEVVLQVCR